MVLRCRQVTVAKLGLKYEDVVAQRDKEVPLHHKMGPPGTSPTPRCPWPARSRTSLPASRCRSTAARAFRSAACPRRPRRPRNSWPRNSRPRRPRPPPWSDAGSPQQDCAVTTPRRGNQRRSERSVHDADVPPSLRLVDFAAFQALAADQRYTQKLLDRTSGGDRVAVSLIRTPAGKGSPEGLHTHDFEQILYVPSGEMNIEIDGEVFVRLPGAWSAFPGECRTGTGMTRGRKTRFTSRSTCRRRSWPRKRPSRSGNARRRVSRTPAVGLLRRHRRAVGGIGDDPDRWARRVRRDVLRHAPCAARRYGRPAR
jgi:hypothetical protein